MASSLEDILLAKAMADAESRMDPAVAMGGGAALGGVLGALAPLGGAKARMAGSLISAILGGGAGLAVNQMTQGESQAANLLARLQSQGAMSNLDRVQLQSVLKDIYNNPVG